MIENYVFINCTTCSMMQVIGTLED